MGDVDILCVGADADGGRGRVGTRDMLRVGADGLPGPYPLRADAD